MPSPGPASASAARKSSKADTPVNQTDLRQFLTEFAAERLALLKRHESGARAVAHYDFNNTYQYVINREETHLSWLQNALAEYKAVLPPAGAAALPAPQ